MRHRFTLEKYVGGRSRHACPSCGKSSEFTRYIDSETGKHLADHVGRCNREIKCGYHYTPKQYFAESNVSAHEKGQRRERATNHLKYTPYRTNFIPFEVFRESLSGYAGNNFVRYLHGLFGAKIAGELIKRFYIGTSNHWEHATVFWQIDVRGGIRTGKIMLYDAVTGRRVKEIKPDGSKRSKITWSHSVLQRRDMVQGFNLRQCMFGEHQLASLPSTRPVAIVEAEKTAVIATAYLPDLVWLACGSSTNLVANKCSALAGRNVILFPDLNCLEKWRGKAKHLQALLDCSINVSDLLEREASDADKAEGFDLADYLVKNESARESSESHSYVTS